MPLFNIVEKYAGRKFSYSDMLARIVPNRDSIIKVNKAVAYNNEGHRMPGFVTEAVNPYTGFSEVIYNNINLDRNFNTTYVQKVVYNKEQVPVATILFKKGDDGLFEAFVLTPGENKEVMQMTPNGDKKFSDEDFFQKFDINNILI